MEASMNNVTRGFLVLAIVTLTTTAWGGGGQVVLEIDPAQSSADFEVCFGGTCDMDDSSVAGFVEIDLDNPNAPTQMSLIDYRLELVDRLDFFIEIFLGSMSLNAQNVAFVDPQPGTPFGPSAIIGDMFEFVNLPVTADGALNYNAVGSACVIVSQQGLPCMGMFDLALLGTITTETFSGEIQIVGGEVTATVTSEFMIVFDPDNPDFGTVTAMSTVVATGTIVTPGDADGDGDVDLADFEAYLDCVTGRDNGPIGATCGVFDFDTDDDVDFVDFSEFQLRYTGE